MKILIADDDLTSRNILSAVLSKWGYEVISTVDGEEALAELKKNDAPQLAVLDWEMPKLDGLHLCKKLREQDLTNPLYIILLTARGDRKDLVHGLEAGADDYIPKPYDNAELKARINVGRRIIMLQNEMKQREKLQGVLEMAGAVCHELNQPLQSVSGFSEILLADIEKDDPNYEALITIKAGIDRIGELTKKIMNITHYKSRPYLKSRIVDISNASQYLKEAVQDNSKKGEKLP